MRKLLILSLFLGLSACGVKPGQVSAPEGSEDTVFPKTYPDIKTDPVPARMRAQ